MSQQKYDRQLRLWSSSGQELISSSRVLAIGTSLSQSELLKNLILGGIGHFTLVAADRKVSGLDIDRNFYLEAEDLGEELGPVLASRLNELNSDTKHDVVSIDMEEGVEDFVRAKGTDYDVIVSDTPLEFELNEEYPPVLEIQSRGFYSLVSLRFVELCIVDSHRSIVPELKLLKPWDELRGYFDSYKLEILSPDELSKVPYPAVLYQMVRKWNNEKKGLPKSNQLSEFKKLIRSLCPNEELLNLEEAVRNSHMVTLKNKGYGSLDFLSDKLKSIGKARFEIAKGTYNDKFWILVYALNEFVAEFGELPTSDELPDMDSDTNSYLRLKEIYRQRFQFDLERFTQILKQVIDEFHISFQIEDEMAVKFVKNCRVLYHTTSTTTTPIAPSSFTDPTQSKFKLIAYTITLLNSLKRPVALNDYEPILQNSEYKTNDTFQSILYEILRAGNEELLNIASITGGVAAQETLKLLMRQYVPLEEIWVFDGISCESDKFKP